MEPTGHGYAYCCPYCDARGTWTILRIGDVVCSWACADHLSQVCEWLQRDFEVTELQVKLFEKAVEWAELHRTLRDVGN